jgi:hypothetical protein
VVFGSAGHESCSIKIFIAAVPRAAMSTAKSISSKVSRQRICVSNGIVRCGQVRWLQRENLPRFWSRHEAKKRPVRSIKRMADIDHFVL